MHLIVQIFVYLYDNVFFMATVNFLYRSNKVKANLQIRLLYSFEGTAFCFSESTKYEVESYYWKNEHLIFMNDIGHQAKQLKVNEDLNKIENHILTAFNSVCIEIVNKEWLTVQIGNYYNPPTKVDSIPLELTNYIDYYINYRKNELKYTSIQKFNVIKKKLQNIQKSTDKIILIKEVNDAFKNDFVDYYIKNDYAKNTIQRELTFVKTICRHARYLGLETSSQLDSLKVDKAKVEKVYLTFKELDKIESIDKKHLTDSLDNAKDWLIISCYTGQRISDFMRFNENQIRIEKDKSLIEFTQQKTGKLMTVPLHAKVLEILEKRKGNFPYSVSDQKYNDYIKVVCELAGLNQLTFGGKQTETEPNSKIFRKKLGQYPKYELVTSHIGRRSFATNFYGKIPTSFLIYITGHSSEFLFLSYVGKSNKDIALELAKYF